MWYSPQRCLFIDQTWGSLQYVSRQGKGSKTETWDRYTVLSVVSENRVLQTPHCRAIVVPSLYYVLRDTCFLPSQHPTWGQQIWTSDCYFDEESRYCTSLSTIRPTLYLHWLFISQAFVSCLLIFISQAFMSCSYIFIGQAFVSMFINFFAQCKVSSVQN